MKNLVLVLITILAVSFVYASGQIDISYAGYTISQPGSYIVVADLYAATNQNAITIATSDVSIDLNGHVLYGAGTATGSTGYGVYGSSNHHNIAVYNGTVRNFRSSGIELYGTNVQVYKIRVFQNRSYGIHLNDSGTVKENTVRENGSYGIWVENGCTVIDNSVFANDNWGIRAEYNCQITGNTVCENNSTGLFAGGRNLVLGNNCTENKGHGIYASRENLVKDNNCSYNGYGSSTGAGIYVSYLNNVIENNLCALNDYGLRIVWEGNYFAGNRFRNNSISSIDTVAGNTGGNGTTGFTNLIIPYAQSNLMAKYFSGYNIPILGDSPDAVVRNLKW